MQPAQTLHNTKQMIIVNSTLKMPKEKLVAHICQASVGAFGEATKADKKIWLKEGRPKIIAQVLCEDDLQDLLIKAERRNLPTFRAKDLDGVICIGIGPVCDTQIEQLKMVLEFYGWVRQNAVNTQLFG